MGEVFMTLKIMPVSPDVDLAKLKEAVKKKAEEIDAKIMMNEIKEEPVAFGLVSLILTVVWPEDRDPDTVEEEFAKVEDVNSLQVIDVRRAIA
ncbi:elongation factor 1-beta [Nanoarchaeota archaeon]